MKIPIFLFVFGAACLSANTFAQQAAAPVQANDFVQLFETISGPQPGHRKAHAHGLCATGSFVPATSEAFAAAPLMTSGELPVVIRFSIGGGNPQADERIPGARGMGMRIELPAVGFHNFTGNNFPVLAGKTPDIFFGFLTTLLPDENGKRNPAKTAAYISEHPSVQANAAWRQSFTLQAEIGEPADIDIDPSVQWPEQRRKVILGTVRLNTAGGETCRQINFDPTVLSADFSPSDDPFLQIRSTAYAISFGKRMSGQ